VPIRALGDRELFAGSPAFLISPEGGVDFFGSFPAINDEKIPYNHGVKRISHAAIGRLNTGMTPRVTPGYTKISIFHKINLTFSGVFQDCFLKIGFYNTVFRIFFFYFSKS
jgi:hypothetical protein